jgi:hypothetical protein
MGRKTQALAVPEPPQRGQKYQRSYWTRTDAEVLAEWDMLSTPPAWMTFELNEALNEISEPHQAKKRITVLRLAEAYASGIGIKATLKHSATCNQSTWYGRPSLDEPGWRDDPAIANALEIATKRALWWYEREETERIARRQRQLALAQDEMVDLTGLALETLADLMLNGESERVRREAAEAVLERADVATASKGTQAHNVNIIASQGPSMAEIRHRERNRAGVPDLDTPVIGDGTDPAGHSPAPPPGIDHQDDLEVLPPPKQRHSDNGNEHEDIVIEHEVGASEDLGD